MKMRCKSMYFCNILLPFLHPGGASAFTGKVNTNLPTPALAHKTFASRFAHRTCVVYIAFNESTRFLKYVKLTTFFSDYIINFFKLKNKILQFMQNLVQLQTLNFV